MLAHPTFARAHHAPLPEGLSARGPTEGDMNSDTAPGTARRLRVLLLITARDEGGAERVAEELVRALADACEMTVVLPAADGMRAFAARMSSNARVVTLPLDRSSRLPSAALHVRRLARRSDVVHLSSNHPASRLGAILSFAVGRAAPLVSVEQGASSPWTVSLPPGFAPLAPAVFRMSRRRAAVVVAVSNENARRLAGEYGIEASRIVTVYNGADLSKFQVSRERRVSRRRQLGIADDERMVIVPARQAPNKGHRFLIAAAREVVDALPRTRFVLAGAGGPDPKVRDAIEQSGLQGAFLDLGFLPHDEMATTIAASDVLALPSLAEGFSVALIEGMAAGAIPVATTVGGAAELIVDGETGFLAPPAEVQPLAWALRAALGLSPEQHAAMADRARARAASFDIKATSAGMMDVYRRAMKRR